MGWSKSDIEEIVDAYLECALWSSPYWGEEDEDAYENMDDAYSVSNIDNRGRKMAIGEVTMFLSLAKMLNYDLITDLGLDLAQVGHDLWLTSNHHGAGFFDGQWNDKSGSIVLGDYLTNLAKEVNAYDPVGIDETTWTLE